MYFRQIGRLSVTLKQIRVTDMRKLLGAHAMVKEATSMMPKSNILHPLRDVNTDALELRIRAALERHPKSKTQGTVRDLRKARSGTMLTAEALAVLPIDRC